MANDRQEERLRKQLEKSEQDLKIFNDAKHSLLTEERFVNFFKDYNPQSVQSFIEHYASQKALWYTHADANARYRRSKNNHWRNHAIKAFKDIYDKKLFNLQCRWIAGEMDLPGIEVSQDFEKWLSNPSLCTVMDPIAEDEFNCYLSFLNEKKSDPSLILYDDDDDDDDTSNHLAIVFYHKVKSISIDEVSKDRYLTPWFKYYDKQFGTGDLLSLPLTRIDIQEDYHDIWSEYVYKKTLTEKQLKRWSHLSRSQRLELRNNPEKHKAYREEQDRLYEEHEKSSPVYFSMSTYDDDKMKELVSLIETPEIQKLYAASRRWSMKHDRHDWIDSDLIYMQTVKEWIPVDSNEDYRNAIKDAYHNYCNKMIMELLPVLFIEYRNSVNTQTPFNWKSSEYGSMPTGNDEIKKRLIAARIYKGEPANLDFLKKENLPPLN